MSSSEMKLWNVDPNVANAIATVASALVIMLWLAPIQDVWTGKSSIYKTKSTKNVATAFGYAAGFFNCLIWNMYAVTRLNIMGIPFGVNAAGFFLNLSFVMAFWWYAEGPKKRTFMIQFAVLTTFLILAITIWIVTGTNDDVGYIAATVNVLMFFGPLAAAGDVIKSRSASGMSFPPLLLTLFCSSAWFAYGVYIQVIPAIIPNAFGIVFGIMQITLYFWAKAQERKIASGDAPLDFEPMDFQIDSPGYMEGRESGELSTLGLFRLPVVVPVEKNPRNRSDDDSIGSTSLDSSDGAHALKSGNAIRPS